MSARGPARSEVNRMSMGLNKAWNSAARMILAAALLALFLAPSIHVAFAGSSLSVTFSSPVYDIGDVVQASVAVPRDGRLAIEVRGPDNSLVWVDERSVSAGSVTVTFQLPSTAPEGVYKFYVSLDNEVPSLYTFTVKRPYALITSIEPFNITVTAGTPLSVKVVVRNTGASGSFEVYVRDYNGSIVSAYGPFTLNYNEAATVQLPVTAPSSPGTYQYSVEVYNVKYSIVDSQHVITVNVIPPAPVTTTTTRTVTRTTVVAPPPAPPAPPVTVTRTVTQAPPATTTVVAPPTATVTKVAQFVSPSVYEASLEGLVQEGAVAAPVKVVVPAGVEVIIPASTKIIGLPAPSKLIIEVINAKLPSPETQKQVGPAVNITFGRPVKLTLPAIVSVSFNPGEVPEGYEVRLAYYNASSQSWEQLPTVRVDYQEGRVIGVTDHFSVFAAVAFPKAAAKPVTVTTTVTSPVTVTSATTVTVPATVTTTVTQPLTTTSLVESTTTVRRTVTVTQPMPVTKSTTVEKTVTVTATKTKIKTVQQTVTTSITRTSTTTVTQRATPSYVPLLAILTVAAIVVALYLYATAGRGGARLQ